MHRPPNHRRAIITGLRQFADFLDLRPDIPLPLIVEISYHPLGRSDEEKRADIDAIAKFLGVTAVYEARGEHYAASRLFGSVLYRAVTVSTKAMDEWSARKSYEHNVQLDSYKAGADE